MLGFMATPDDVRRIARELPGVVESEENFLGFSVIVKGKPKGFVWTWMERVQEKKPKVPNHGVVAVTVPGELVKEMLIASDPSVYFTEPHYAGFPAILVRIEKISVEELEQLIENARKAKLASFEKSTKSK